MKRSISQRIYLWGLMPLALLAIGLTIYNGIERMKDAKQELNNEQTLTATLLHTPAIDALVVGNTLTFDQLVKDVITNTPHLVCISLSDLGGNVVSEEGKCSSPSLSTDIFDVFANNDSLSDYAAAPAVAAKVGTLRVSMSTRGLVKKKQRLALLLVINLALILCVVALIVHVLRVRLIKPIQAIDATMVEVSQRNYTLRVESVGDDEIGRLGLAINKTLETIADYTLELERRRADADRALHDADEAALARDGLIRSLSEELEGPLSGMYSELTALAMANKDSSIRERIKSAMGLLDEVQSTLDDLMEVATSSQGARNASMQELADVSTELTRSMRKLSASEGKPLSMEGAAAPQDLPGVYVDLDGNRIRKAVAYVLRAMFQHCSAQGVFAQFDTIKLSDDKLHLSMQLKAFFEPPPNFVRTVLVPLAPNSKAVPAALRWTERDKKVIEHLLRAASIAATYSVLPSGMVFIHLETVVRYSAGTFVEPNSLEWLKSPATIVTTIVSNDIALLKYTTRGHLSRHEVKLLPYQAAFECIQELQGEDVLLIDCSPDMVEVFKLIEDIGAAVGNNKRLPLLVAICPPGEISMSLENRLIQWGFKAVLQKPIQMRTLFEVIQKVVAESRERDNA